MKRTIRMNSLLACASLSFLLASQTMAATIRYQNSGDYFDTVAVTGVNGWQTGGGGPGGLPGAADTIRFNWGNNTVTLAGAAPNVALYQIGVDESGGLIVNNGGSLTSTGNSTIGNNAGGGGANPTTGFLTINSGGVVNNNGAHLRMGVGASTALGNLKGLLTIDGGTMNNAGHLWVGVGNLSIGTVEIQNGGVLNVGGMLGLGTLDSTTASGGFGFLNVNSGGTLNLANIQATAVGSIQSGSLLDISGSGLVTLPGNFVGILNDYISAGRITGDDVVGNVQAVFHPDLNKTFLTVVPEPSSFALLAFAGLAWVFRRRN